MGSPITAVDFRLSVRIRLEVDSSCCLYVNHKLVINRTQRCPQRREGYLGSTTQGGGVGRRRGHVMNHVASPSMEDPPSPPRRPHRPNMHIGIQQYNMIR